jgi:hypothetical protein
MTEHNAHGPNLDPQLTHLAAEIDKLSLNDQPSAGFEERLYSATLPVLQGAVTTADAPRLVLVGTGVEVRRRLSLNAPMRLAASIALLATVGAVWLANRPTVSALTTGGNQAVDDWAMVSSLFEDGSVKALEEIASDTSSLDDRIRSLSEGDLGVEEGSM